jgi:hypothetical protein
VPIWTVEVALAAVLIVPIVITMLQSGPGPAPEPQPAAVVVAAPAIEPTVESAPTVAPVESVPDDEGPYRALVHYPKRPPIVESTRHAHVRDSGVDPHLKDMAYAEQELLRLRAELEAIQRNAAQLRSLARQQSGDLSLAYSSLEATQERKEGALNDLEARISELEQRIIVVDELARDLRRVLGLPDPGSGVGGSAPAFRETEDADPWLLLRAEIATIEHQAESLVFNLDEISTEIQIRLLSVQMTGLPRSGSTYEDLLFYEQMPVG